jgi:hypothetical protein
MPIILQIRGTSGSGKSTAVRAVMAMANEVRPVTPAADFPKQRRNPVGYVASWNTATPHFPGARGMVVGQCDVFFPGHYETACGGMDTLPSYAVSFGLIKVNYELGRNVVCEGLLAAHDKKQTLAVWEAIGRKDLAILELAEPLEVCLDSVRGRRAARGADPDTFNPQNTIRRYQEVVRSCLQLEEHGIPVHRVTREQVVPKITELLGLKLQEIAA